MTQELREELTAQMAYERPIVDRYEDVYKADTRQGFMTEEVRRAFGSRALLCPINLGPIVLHPINQRLQIPAWMTSLGDLADDDVTSEWRRAGGDRVSALAHLEAMKVGWSYVGVTVTDGRPVMTAESPRQVTVKVDPLTGKNLAGLKRYRRADGRTCSMVWHDDVLDTYVSAAAVGFQPAWGSTPTVLAEDMILESSEWSPLGVPFVMLSNNPQVGELRGLSDLADIEPLLLALAKLGADMMLASEAAALPRRWLATPANVTEEQAKAVQEVLNRTLTRVGGTTTAVIGGGATLSEFGTASLENFDTAIRLLISQVAAIGSLPPYFVSGDVANPTSADAIRSSESRLTAKALERQRWFAPSWADVMRLVMLARDGVADPRLDTLIPIFMDPAPASVAQAADAAAKLVSAKIIDQRNALESLGLPPLEIERILAAQIVEDPADGSAPTGTDAPAAPAINMTFGDRPPMRKVIERDAQGNLVAVVEVPA
ncbi:MAG: phage portal protein [Actinobacteria bacterium]|nr:phage portal protein [Actinomycetota bacterium]